MLRWASLPACVARGHPRLRDRASGRVRDADRPVVRVMTVPRTGADSAERIRGLVKIALQGSYCQPLTGGELARVVVDPAGCTAS
jgi:hypothetical protein